MEEFRDCLADCGLVDLGFSGYPYTWDNKRDGGENVQVRLDRATCNEGFLDLFPETTVEHVMTKESDHQAILIRAMETASTRRPGGGRPFRFEEAWTRHEKYDEMVAEAWESSDGNHRTWGLKGFMHACSGWAGLRVRCKDGLVRSLDQSGVKSVNSKHSLLQQKHEQWKRGAHWTPVPLRKGCVKSMPGKSCSIDNGRAWTGLRREIRTLNIFRTGPRIGNGKT
uniref:Endonuclease/exonuclease/phosphatase domain-containing protein n=1 Tax=Aegilops tauschii subsp. strangulata TaxID=200361 RepID=A0A453NDY0_AEGTS